MEHDEIVKRLDNRCDKLENKIDKIDDKVDNFIAISAANQKDISWLRGSVKLIATMLITVGGIIVTAYFRTLN
jgi:peptidoglycan hydrolase CwlO-like protein